MIACPDCTEERYCDASVAECPNQRAAALDAGIPLAVIEGSARLGAPPPDDSEQYRQDMRDGGRGRLVRA